MMDSRSTRWAQVLFLVCLGLGLAKAQVHTVSAVPGLAEYTILQEAIDEAGVEDTVYLYPGSYAGTIEKRLTLIGSGYRKTDNQSVEAGLTISDNAVLSSLNILSGGSGSRVIGLYISNLSIRQVSNVTVEKSFLLRDILFDETMGVILRQCFLARDGNNVRYMRFRSSVDFLVSNCVVDRFGLSGNSFNMDVNSQGVFLNNIFTHFGYGVRNSVLKNNIFSSTVGSNVIQSGYSNNIFNYNASRTGFGSNGIAMSDPGTQFAGRNQTELSFDAYYQLIENSSFFTAGENGREVGVFGGDFPYQLSGLPAIPLIYDLEMPDNLPTGQPLNVNVKVRTQN